MTSRREDGLFAQVAVEHTVYHFDKLFTYRIPDVLAETVQPGVRVKVPFGQGNRLRVALVFSVTRTPVPGAKEILEALDLRPVLSKGQLDLAAWMGERYFCTLYESAKLMIPAGIHLKLQNRYTLHASFKNFDEEAFSPFQWQIIQLLRASVKALPFEVLARHLPMTETDKEFTALLAAEVVVKVTVAAQKVKDATAKLLRPIPGYCGKLSKRQQELYDRLQEFGVVSEKEFRYFTGATGAILRAMGEKGLLERFEYEVYRRPVETGDGERKGISLSPPQEKVFQGLLKQWEAIQAKGLEPTERLREERVPVRQAPSRPVQHKQSSPQQDPSAKLPSRSAQQRENPSKTDRPRIPSCGLLYGVTGSGKTSVYLKLIEAVRQRGRGVIAMVPEIALTPQAIRVFGEVFGEDIAVFHSGLSMGERLDEWKRVSRGEAGIVVGTRSAIFAPVKDLGLVESDEEQENSYRSESAPRYDAREVARWRCVHQRALCLLSSATPSMESAYAAQKRRYAFYRLEQRYGTAQLPEVDLVDLGEEPSPLKGVVMGSRLGAALRENLEAGHQSIILLNRRGYHTYVSCQSCKEVISCPDCSISMTYHAANNRLMCHYCGHSVPYSEICPRCKEPGVTTRGVGTQRMEEELQRVLPEARILRMDTDAVSPRNGTANALKAFAEGRYDIMVGTQMVAKGLDFENVTLVGVVSADQMLYSDDFRSNERTFDLLTQVVGRAGRGVRKGHAMIQTYQPGNPYLHLASAQDYFGFYRRELAFRKAMLYPPFADLLVMVFMGTEERQTQKAAAKFGEMFRQLAQSAYPDMPLRILKATPATVVKVSGKYRYRMIVKCRNTKRFREMIRLLLLDFAKEKAFQGITAYADGNPAVIL